MGQCPIMGDFVPHTPLLYKGLHKSGLQYPPNTTGFSGMKYRGQGTQPALHSTETCYKWGLILSSTFFREEIEVSPQPGVNF